MLHPWKVEHRVIGAGLVFTGRSIHFAGSRALRVRLC